MRRVGGCLVVAALLAAVAAAAWVFRDELLRRFGGAPVYTEVSPEAAASAEAKLERLRTHGDTARLSEIELASLLRYRTPGGFAELLQDPSVDLAGDTLRIGARLPTELLPRLRELDRVRAFLPDTTRIDLAGRLAPLERGRAAVQVEEVAVAGVPIPSRFYPDVLERLGRRDEPGLPANALAVSLPPGVGSAYVAGSELVLTP